MRFGTWNVRSPYRASSLTSAARKLARRIVDLVCVQEVSWDKGTRLEQGIKIFSTEKEAKINKWEKNFLYTTE